jgi:hypothetical protein
LVQVTPSSLDQTSFRRVCVPPAPISPSQPPMTHSLSLKTTTQCPSRGEKIVPCVATRVQSVPSSLRQISLLRAPLCVP